MDKVRVLRVLEYIGPRDRVESTVAMSIHGERELGNGLTIKGVTVGTYPEILEQCQPIVDDPRAWEGLQDA